MPAAHGRPDATEPGPRPGTAASAVLMVRPASFGWNPETEASNSFQRSIAGDASFFAVRAREEFDAVAGALLHAGVAVHAFDDLPEPACPDAVFPNNWVSFHGDGTVVLYPMLAPNRRLERRRDLFRRLEEAGFRIRRLVDLTHHETRGAFLEGTGSLVLDHAARVAYACLSPRTHEAPLREFCGQLGFEPCVFRAVDAGGRPVYHTNVVLSVGASLAVAADRNILAEDRESVLAKLERAGRRLLTIDDAQAAAFAANVLELRAGDGASVLAMSAAAAAAFGEGGLSSIRALVDRIVSVPIPTIEALGGGSVRCMIAEVFLPRSAVP